MRLYRIAPLMPTALLAAGTVAALLLDSQVAHALAPVLLAAAILWRGPRRPPMRGDLAAVRRPGASVPSGAR